MVMCRGRIELSDWANFFQRFDVDRYGYPTRACLTEENLRDDIAHLAGIDALIDHSGYVLAHVERKHAKKVQLLAWAATAESADDVEVVEPLVKWQRTRPPLKEGDISVTIIDFVQMRNAVHVALEVNRPFGKTLPSRAKSSASKGMGCGVL